MNTIKTLLYGKFTGNQAKWSKPVKNLEINEMVLIKENNTISLRGPRGQIVQIFPGVDGKVRVAQVRTSKGLFTRPVSKLCALPNSNTDI